MSINLKNIQQVKKIPSSDLHPKDDDEIGFYESLAGAAESEGIMLNVSNRSVLVSKQDYLVLLGMTQECIDEKSRPYKQTTVFIEAIKKELPDDVYIDLAN